MRLLIVAAVCLVLACGPASGSSSSSPQAAPRASSETAGASPTDAPRQPVPLRVAYSELTPAQYANWVAYEAGIYARNGLDVTMNYITSAQTTTAVIANEVDVA